MLPGYIAISVGGMSTAKANAKIARAEASATRLSRLHEGWRQRAMMLYGECDACGRTLAYCQECGSWADDHRESVCSSPDYVRGDTEPCQTAPQTHWSPAEYETVCRRCIESAEPEDYHRD